MLETNPSTKDVLRANQDGSGYKRNMKADMKSRTYSIDGNNVWTACKACQKQTGKQLIDGLCVKCDSKLTKASDFAQSHGGSANIGPKPRSIEFTCRRDHVWVVQFAKVGRSWCSTCRKIEQELRKRRCQEYYHQVEKELIENQRQQVFNTHTETVQKSLGEETTPGSTPGDSPSAVALDYNSQVLSDSIAAEASEEPVPEVTAATSDGKPSSHLSAEALNSLPRAEFWPEQAFKS